MTKESSTTRDNYEERVHGQPGLTSNEVESGPGWSFSQRLNNLFIDIATLAVNLDVRYVWVDSICIIQQDAEDWENEATMMAGYYQHAWLTVAATKTIIQGGGFLRQTHMDPRSIPRVSRLPYRDREGTQQGYFYLQGLPDSTLRREYEDNIINSDLLDRGWVFQEWILSPRILCFSTLVPFLVCGELPPLPITGDVMTNNEVDTVQTQRDDPNVRDPFLCGDHGLFEHGYKNRLGLDLTTSRAAIFETWRKLIMAYSGLELTSFENDRLVALAGIAKEIGLALSSGPVNEPAEVRTERQSKYCNTYACGAWLGDIVLELQWERSDGLKKPPCRARGFPTWSWLSFGSPTIDGTGRPALGGARVMWPNFEVRSEFMQYLWDFSRTVHRRMPDPVRCVSLKSAHVIPTGMGPDGWFTNLNQSDEWRVLGLSDSVNDYGNSNRFVGLCFQQAKLIDVQLGPHFDSQKHSSIAARCTHHESNVQRDHWRVITLPSLDRSGGNTQEIIRGWASLEHPDYQRPERDPDGGRTLALRIARLPEVNGLGGWFISGFDTVEIVLYVRRVGQGQTGDRHCFERLGVGRLFGSEIANELAAAEEGEVWLV